MPSIAARTIRIPNIALRALAGDPIRSGVAAIYRTRETSPAVKNFIRQIVQSSPVDISLSSELS